MSISIIIPVRNEENHLGPCLDSLPQSEELEILVVDGNSRDQTVQLAEKRQICCLQSIPGRGSQLHTGALAAGREILLFLHCDCRLPKDFSSLVRDCLREKGVAAGAFRLAIDAPGRCFRAIEQGANLRSRLLQLPYGDQGLFMYRKTYFAAGGFPSQPLLEDVALVKRLQKMGKITLAPASISTSARRWNQKGVFKTTLINQLILAGYHAGIAPKRLARWYYGAR